MTPPHLQPHEAERHPQPCCDAGARAQPRKTDTVSASPISFLTMQTHTHTHTHTRTCAVSSLCYKHTHTHTHTHARAHTSTYLHDAAFRVEGYVEGKQLKPVGTHGGTYTYTHDTHDTGRGCTTSQRWCSPCAMCFPPSPCGRPHTSSAAASPVPLLPPSPHSASTTPGPTLPTARRPDSTHGGSPPIPAAHTGLGAAPPAPGVNPDSRRAATRHPAPGRRRAVPTHSVAGSMASRQLEAVAAW